MPLFADDIARLIPHLRRFARALVCGHAVQTADDLVQETVVLAMRAERIACGSNLTTWCFSTLMRVHRLRDHAVAHADDRPAAVSGPASRPDTAVPFMPKPIARLDMLSLDCREVLLLTVLVGMTYAQIAETLHITVDTVMHRLDLARALLAKAERGAAPVSHPLAAHAAGRPQREARHLRVVK